ncbi:protease inhibitor I42 family protein [Amycolatopsis suaedae]|uniref:Proteinase inhibitor I42 chagasin domain-containing protein n=1 Tax=Amycolatopsis suaedae TaxID=2510978 RepID=A0A4V2EMI9_9PSEU|nr:protease inhibitor I42 family protein [Amycolatopsis suaedae]RZQ65225.1 hypothetical protein EWH70_04875 [Amycolatopsis suaedae]
MFVQLAQSDAGAATELRVGDTVELRLPETPTTGYRWRWRLPEGVRLVADEHIAPFSAEEDHPQGGREASGAGPPGMGGVRRLALEITGAGRHLLEADLARPWEGEPRRSLSFVLTTVRDYAK